MLDWNERINLAQRFFELLKKFSDEKFYSDLAMLPVLEEISNDVVVQAAYDNLKKYAKKISNAHYRSVCARKKYFLEEGVEYLEKQEAEYKKRKEEHEQYLKEMGVK